MHSAHQRPHHTAPRYTPRPTASPTPRSADAPVAHRETAASMNTTERIHRALFSDYVAPRRGTHRTENR